MTKALLAFAAAMFAACDERGGLAHAGEALGRRLAGTWDVRLELTDAPLRRAPRMASVRGSMAFLESRWLAGRSDYGTYDIDFRPFGFDPRDAGETPTATASAANDSLAISLGRADGVAVIMRGRMVGDSIVGSWRMSRGRAGGSGGHFVMRRATRS